MCGFLSEQKNSVILYRELLFKNKPINQSNTHSIAGNQKVDNVVIKRRKMIANVQLGVFVSGARVFLSDVHSQNRAHDSHDESKSNKGEEFIHNISISISTPQGTHS